MCVCVLYGKEPAVLFKPQLDPPLKWRCFDVCVYVCAPVLKDPDSNPYSLLEGEGEQAEAADGAGAGDRRRRDRRRRNDQEPSVMDAATEESDGQAATSDNGLGEQGTPPPAPRGRGQGCSVHQGVTAEESQDGRSF